MNNSVAFQIERALQRLRKIEGRYPEIQEGKNAADRDKLRSLLMSPEDYRESKSIGTTIVELERAL